MLEDTNSLDGAHVHVNECASFKSSTSENGKVIHCWYIISCYNLLSSFMLDALWFQNLNCANHWNLEAWWRLLGVNYFWTSHIMEALHEMGNMQLSVYLFIFLQDLNHCWSKEKGFVKAWRILFIIFFIPPINSAYLFQASPSPQNPLFYQDANSAMTHYWHAFECQLNTCSWLPNSK